MIDRTMATYWSRADTELLEHIYELQSKSLTNRNYYARRLKRVQSIAFWMEVMLAATASGSGLASLASGMAGKEIWQVILLAIAVIAVIKPIYSPGKKIERLSRLVQGYSTNY